MSNALVVAEAEETIGTGDVTEVEGCLLEGQSNQSRALEVLPPKGLLIPLSISISVSGVPK